LPLEILDAPSVEEVRPTVIPSTRVAPDADLVRSAAILLSQSRKPMFYIGDGVAFSEAQEEVARVAELLGAEVWGVDMGEVNLAWNHPLFMGMTGHMFGYASKPITMKGDVNLIVGTYVMPEVFPEIGPIFAPGSKAIHIDLNAYEIGKNHPVDLGMVSDPKRTLSLLADMLESELTPAQRGAARARMAALAQEKETRLAQERDQDRSRRDAMPMHFSRVMEELADKLPRDAIIFDEALTNSPPVARYLPPTKPRGYFLTRGGSLGVGLPGAIGAKLANPTKTVVGIGGDGGSMYTIQALWTAARHNVGAKFIICNNGSYRLLQLNLLAYWKERGLSPQQQPLSFDLSKPALDFAALARGLSVESARIAKPAEVGPALARMLAHPGPFLLDVQLEGDTHPELIGVRCVQ
jgi:benzoylformate decarboxylase